MKQTKLRLARHQAGVLFDNDGQKIDLKAEDAEMLQQEVLTNVAPKIKMNVQPNKKANVVKKSVKGEPMLNK